MSYPVFRINKGINKSVEFKGLKAQYIWWLGGGVVCLLVLFAILYILGVNNYVCVVVILCLGGGVVWYVFHLSHKYGEYGMMKAAARRKVPSALRCRSRNLFINVR